MIAKKPTIARRLRKHFLLKARKLRQRIPIHKTMEADFKALAESAEASAKKTNYTKLDADAPPEVISEKIRVHFERERQKKALKKDAKKWRKKAELQSAIIKGTGLGTRVNLKIAKTLKRVERRHYGKRKNN